MEEIVREKDFLMIQLWKMGMAGWVRKTIWPLAIGNKLEVTQSLYVCLLNQSCPVPQEMAVELAAQEHPEQTQNILLAFLAYRADISYLPGMVCLASLLLSELEEYPAFQCLANLLHSHHFLPFIKGDVSEVVLSL